MPTLTYVELQRLERNEHVKSVDLRQIAERRLSSSQPITQVSLDPKLNDVRHLRADRGFDEAIACFGPSLTASVVQTVAP
jgi:hypothetical protein